MDIFDELGLHRYINAQDTFTKYGASCMPESSLKAMYEISRYCVDLYEVQEKVGDAIAKLTHNEAAYITNGAAGALTDCSAAVLSLDSLEAYHRLPETDGRDQILMQRAHHNLYDRSMACTGAKIVYVGEETRAPSAEEFENAINEHTAAIGYVIYFGRDYSLPLETVVEIAHRHNLPVIVDAAAQNPPASNLWHFSSEIGADMVIFSGGKTIRGPQDSGLVVGKKIWIDRLRKLGPPMDGVCRECKTSREAIVGLYAAVKEYMAVDEEARMATLRHYCDIFEDMLRDCGFKDVFRDNEGPVGQTFPRSCAYMPFGSVDTLFEKCKARGVYISNWTDNMLWISPLILDDAQVETVCRVVREAIEEMRKEQSENGSN